MELFKRITLIAFIVAIAACTSVITSDLYLSDLLSKDTKYVFCNMAIETSDTEQETIDNITSSLSKYFSDFKYVRMDESDFMSTLHFKYKMSINGSDEDIITLLTNEENQKKAISLHINSVIYEQMLADINEQFSVTLGYKDIDIAFFLINDMKKDMRINAQHVYYDGNATVEQQSFKLENREKAKIEFPLFSKEYLSNHNLQFLEILK